MVLFGDSKDTKPEVYLRKLLFAHGLRYRKNVPQIPGHPDIYLARYRIAIFVHGCFWHRHQECKYAYIPKSRVNFWKNKFDANIKQDLIVREKLTMAGIRQVIVWECTIRTMQRDKTVEQTICSTFIEFLKGNLNYLEM